MLTWKRAIGVFAVLFTGASAQLQPGDIAFTGFNADGADKAGYLAALNTAANWQSQDGAGDQHADLAAPDLPFSATAFTFIPGDAVPPTVSQATLVDSATLKVVFSEPVDSASAADPTNYGLSPTLAIATVTYSLAESTATVVHAPFVPGTAYVLQVQGVKDTSDNVMSAPFQSNPMKINVVPALTFDKAFYSVKENAGSLSVKIKTSAAPSDTARVGIRLVPAGTAVAGSDFTFADQTFVWPRDSAGTMTLSIPLTNNATAQTDRFFVLELNGPSNATLGSATRLSVYILDDDFHAPAGSDGLDLRFVSSFKVDSTAGSSAEIVAHDPKSQRLFVMNSTRDRLEILDFGNPKAMRKIKTVDLTAYGSGGTSVAVRDGLVAVTVDSPDFAPGKVVFLDTAGTVLKSVEVGSLPDMVTFTPDGKYVLTANEGQPSGDYTVDPEGSVSIIDLAGGIDSLNQGRVATAGFQSFNDKKEALQAAGARIFGPNATVAQDLEPEYIAVSADSKTAWVTLQENNAIAWLDLRTKTFTDIRPLGFKDHSQTRNALDVSDQLDSNFFGTWPVKGVYMPDAIAGLKVGDTTWLFTANEGDAREYSALTEEIRVGASGYALDTTVFPNAAVLKLPTNLGRLTVSSATGDSNHDGKFEEIHVLGARSFSVWNGTTGAQAWDSGDELERITAADPDYRSLFNASHDNNSRKNRSDNKGPEPEGITVATIGDKHYAFIALERIGGLMAYNVTNPRAPRFVAYANNRPLGSLGGDLGSEGVIFIPRGMSPNDTALVVLANEISATVSVYSVKDANIPVGISRPASGGAAALPKVTLHRARGQNLVYFSRPTDFTLTDTRGRVQLSGKGAAWADLRGLKKGRYFLSVPGIKTFALPVWQ